MDCSVAGTSENDNIPLSFFFLAKLVTEQSGKLYCCHLKWSVRYVLYPGKALVDSTLVGLVESTLQTWYFLMTFWTLTLIFGTHKLSLPLAIMVAVPRCTT